MARRTAGAGSLRRRVAPLLVVAAIALVFLITAPVSHALVSTGDGSLFWRSPQPQGNALWAGCAAGTTLWAVGDGGTMMHSADAGVSWTAVPSGTALSLEDVEFWDALNGWVVGGGEAWVTWPRPRRAPVIRVTDDGGLTWRSCPSPVRRVLAAVAPLGHSRACAVGDAGTVLTTADDGASWTARRTGVTADLVCLERLRSGVLLAGGPRGKLVRSADGGATWNIVRLPAWGATGRVASMAAAGDGAVWAIMLPDWYLPVSSSDPVPFRAKPSIIRSDDGGRHWRRIRTAPGLELWSLAAAADGGVWVAASEASRGYEANLFLHRSDVTGRWRSRYFDGVYAHDLVAWQGGLCAVGDGIATHGGTGWVSHISWTSVPCRFDMVDPTHGWGITPTYDEARAWIVRTTDGVTWDSVEPAPADPCAIQFADLQHGWITGRDGVYATADGGATWRRQWSDSYGWLGKCCFVDALHGWVCSNVDRFILATTDGGQTWSKQELTDADSMACAHDVFFFNQEEGWAAGWYSSDKADGRYTVAHTTDGGQTWQAVPTGVTEYMDGEDICFVDAQHGWICGTLYDEGYSWSTMIATSDGGQTWSVQGKGTAMERADLTDVEFTDDLHGWAFGTTVWRTEDGGVHWNRVQAGAGWAFSDADRCGDGILAANESGLLSTDDLRGDTAPPSTATDADERWHRRPVTVTVTAGDVGGAVVSTEYSMDAEEMWRPCDGKVLVPAPPDHTNDGRHRVWVRSTDDSGNVEPSTYRVIGIDTLGPSTEARARVRVTSGSRATFPYIVHESLSRHVQVTLVVRRTSDHKAVRRFGPFTCRSGKAAVRAFRVTLPPGRYVWEVRAVDEAGNPQVRVGKKALVVLPAH